MISIEQINGEIATLEEQVPTHVVMQKLASLYTVRDHMIIPQTGEVRQDIPDTLTNYGVSDFLTAINGKSTKNVMLVVDELIEAVEVLNPRLTSNFFEKLNDIK